jgi:hypothetical protein
MLAVEVSELPAEPYRLLLELLDGIQPGEVVVGAVQAHIRAALWGELLSTHTRAKGGRGVVLDGLSRDSWGIEEMKFPVFATGLTPADSKGRLEVISIRGTIPVGGVSVADGDLIVADSDGCVVVPAAIEDEIVASHGEGLARTPCAMSCRRAPTSKGLREYGILNGDSIVQRPSRRPCATARCCARGLAAVGWPQAPNLLIRLPYDKNWAKTSATHPSGTRAMATRSFAGRRGRWVWRRVHPHSSRGGRRRGHMAWFDSLPFSTAGSVCTVLISRPPQLQIAVRKPAGLRCMVPAMTSPDLYEGWAYNNGAFALAFNASWATFLADDVARRRDPDSEPGLAAQYAKINDYYWWLPLSAIPNLGPGGPGGFFADWLAHETKDGYWKQWDVTDKLLDDVPTMAVAAYDVFLEAHGLPGHSPRSWIRGTQVLSSAPGTTCRGCRLGDVDFGPGPKPGRPRAGLFDQWLRDADPAKGRASASSSPRQPVAGFGRPPRPRRGRSICAPHAPTPISGDGYRRRGAYAVGTLTS